MSSLSPRSKLSPHIPRSTLDSPEIEGFSDDSGVDLRPQGRCSEQNSTTYVGESRRNKRKSSEPRRRKDVLQMKRFQWESDEDDGDADGERELVSDSDEVFEDGERPSSGDSGFQSGPQTVSLSTKVERPSKQDWRKPRVRQQAAHQEAKPHSSTLRQSVIQKHDSVLRPSTSSTTLSPECLHSSPVGLTAAASGSSSSLSDHPPLTGDILTYDDLEGGQGTPTSTTSRSPLSSRSSGRPRNYKSMSRQRRIEANARERSRVHTISAAFESLRRAVPAYAHNQKLSKLAILRIASAYIVALACLNQQHTSKEVTEPAIADCVDQCTRTIQAEGRTRRRPKE